MTRALHNATIVADGRILTGQAVLIDDRCIADVVSVNDVPAGVEHLDLGGGLLLPGFIDVQVNGGGGVLFNDDPSVETIRRIGEAHARFGTTGFLPTLISADYPSIKRAIAAVDEAILQGVPGVLGIHIEGPFLNIQRKGIHNPDNFRALDDEGVELLSSLPHGRTLVTLAPEISAPGKIARLIEKGVIVSAGHSECDYETARDGFKNGIRGVTHLFNAMSQMQGRRPGLVGAALENQDVWCGIIADGHHVHPGSLRVALGCRGLDRMMLVSDAMPGVGSDKPSFALQGQTITIKDGMCTGPDGTLAGSHLDMATAFCNAMEFFGLDAAKASLLASGNAAAFLGLAQKTGRIAKGLSADLVLLDATGKVKQTWIAGQSVR